MKLKGKKYRKGASFTFLFLFLITAGITISLMIQTIDQDRKTAELREETMEEYVNRQTDGSLEIDWDGLKAVNPDVTGWISFQEPSPISYPIVQGNSNQYYLHHNWKREEQECGAIFLHKDNSTSFTDDNSILYGHRMRDGSMFGSLKEYESQTYLAENRFFDVYLPNGEICTYEICLFAAVKDASYVYTRNFSSCDTKADYIKKLQAQVLAGGDTEASETDRLLTLSTCAGSGYDDRIIVQARLTGTPERRE